MKYVIEDKSGYRGEWGVSLSPPPELNPVSAIDWGYGRCDYFCRVPNIILNFENLKTKKISKKYVGTKVWKER